MISPGPSLFSRSAPLRGMKVRSISSPPQAWTASPELCPEEVLCLVLVEPSY